MNQYVGKKLLILGGAAVHCKVVEAAKKMGIYTIVSDYLENSPAKKTADENWMLSVTDADAIIAKCREQNVDGVINFCNDPAQRYYQQICEKLEVPCCGNEEQFRIMTDKKLFKKFCQKVGIDIIPEYTLEDMQTGRGTYPVLVKPADSRGSRGQRICWTLEQVENAVECASKEARNGQYIIEKYMAGKQDFSMTYFVCEGIPYLVRTCDRYLGRVEDNLNTQCVGAICPSKHKDFYVEKVHEKICSFIKELGIKYGPVFMQGFIDDDTIRFYDPGLRFPGGEYELLLKEITGVDLMSLMVEYALTGKMEDVSVLEQEVHLLNKNYVIQLPITARPGKIMKLNELSEICSHQDVMSAFRRYEEGEIVPSTGDVRQRICEVSLMVDEGKKVAERVKWVQSKLKALDENGENMLVSMLDVTLLDY